MNVRGRVEKTFVRGQLVWDGTSQEDKSPLGRLI